MALGPKTLDDGKVVRGVGQIRLTIESRVDVVRAVHSQSWDFDHSYQEQRARQLGGRAQDLLGDLRVVEPNQDAERTILQPGMSAGGRNQQDRRLDRS